MTAGTAAANINQALSLTQQRASNGDIMHEVRWLPTSADETFTTPIAASSPGVGTVYAILTGIDSTTTSASVATLNGRVEVTTVWEWIPAVFQGLSATPRAPNPYTSQQVLSTIVDMGAYLFRGMRTGTGVGGMIRNMTLGYTSGVTRGTRAIAYGGGGLT